MNISTEQSFGIEFGRIVTRAYRRNQALVENPAVSDFARYLRAARTALGWSRLRLAERSGLTPALILALELGALPNDRIENKHLDCLAKALEEDPRLFAILLERTLPQAGPVDRVEQLRGGWQAATSFFGSRILTLVTLGLAMSVGLMAGIGVLGLQLFGSPAQSLAPLFAIPSLLGSSAATLLSRTASGLLHGSPLTLAAVLGLTAVWRLLRRRETPPDWDYRIRRHLRGLAQLSIVLLTLSFAWASTTHLGGPTPRRAILLSKQPPVIVDLDSEHVFTQAIRIYEAMSTESNHGLVWIQSNEAASPWTTAFHFTVSGDISFEACDNDCDFAPIIGLERKSGLYSATVRIYRVASEWPGFVDDLPTGLPYRGNVTIRTNANNPLVESILSDPNGLAMWCVDTGVGGFSMQAGCALTPILPGTQPGTGLLDAPKWVNEPINHSWPMADNITHEPGSQPTFPTPNRNFVTYAGGEWATTSLQPMRTPRQVSGLAWSRTWQAIADAEAVSARPSPLEELQGLSDAWRRFALPVVVVIQLLCLGGLYRLMWSEIRREGVLKLIHARRVKKH